MVLTFGIAVIFLTLTVPISFSKEQPPKGSLVISLEFKNVADNSWSNLEFLENVQPPGLYYIELTDVSGSIGCWGSKKDPYPDGTAWQDGEPLDESDFKLQYQLDKKGTWEELIIIAPQGAIGDTWFPFPLHDAEESIGQTFTAPGDFTGVGLQTPTWVTATSGCIISLWSEQGEQHSVKPFGKLATNWGRLKREL